MNCLTYLYNKVQGTVFKMKDTTVNFVASTVKRKISKTNKKLDKFAFFLGIIKKQCPALYILRNQSFYEVQTSE